MPVTVDLPLVPPTAMLLCAALSSLASSCGRVRCVEAELAGADDVGDGLLDRRRGDQGHALGEAGAVLREQGRCRASADNRTWAPGGRRRANGRSRRRARRRRGGWRRAAACRCRRFRRRNIGSVIGRRPYAGARPCAIDAADEDRGGRAKLHAEARGRRGGHARSPRRAAMRAGRSIRNASSPTAISPAPTPRGSAALREVMADEQRRCGLVRARRLWLEPHRRGGGRRPAASGACARPISAIRDAGFLLAGASTRRARGRARADGAGCRCATAARRRSTARSTGW